MGQTQKQMEGEELRDHKLIHCSAIAMASSGISVDLEQISEGILRYVFESN